MIYRRFCIIWREIWNRPDLNQYAQRFGSAVSAAANACAQKEPEMMIFARESKAGYEGLQTAEGAFK